MSENRRRGAARRRPARAAEGALRRGLAAAHRPRAEPPGLAGRAHAPGAPGRGDVPVRALRAHRGQRRRRRGAPRRLHLRRRPEVGRRVHRRRPPLRLQQRLHRRLRPRRPRRGAARGQPRVREPRLRGRRRAVSADLRDAPRPQAHRRRLQDRRRGVGGARAARRRQRGLDAGARRSAQPPDRRPLAVPLRRAGVAAHRPGGHRRDVRQLLRRRSRRGGPPCPARRTSRPACRSWSTRRGARCGAAASTFRAATTGGWSRSIPTIRGRRRSSTPRSAASATRTSGCARRRASRWPDTWGTTAFAATCGSSSPTAFTAPATTRAIGRCSPSGTLYAARFNPDGTGEWRPLTLGSRLDPNPDPADAKPFIPSRARTLADCYESLGAIVTDAYPAANAVGATPTGRPEELEVHPTDGSVYVAFTSAAAAAGMWDNIYGQVWRLEEEKGDVRSRRFRWTRFVAGGPGDPAKAGHVFAQPDNLAFDAAAICGSPATSRARSSTSAWTTTPSRTPASSGSR